MWRRRHLCCSYIRASCIGSSCRGHHELVSVLRWSAVPQDMPPFLAQLTLRRPTHERPWTWQPNLGHPTSVTVAFATSRRWQLGFGGLRPLSAHRTRIGAHRACCRGPLLCPLSRVFVEPHRPCLLWSLFALLQFRLEAAAAIRLRCGMSRTDGTDISQVVATTQCWHSRRGTPDQSASACLMLLHVNCKGSHGYPLLLVARARSVVQRGVIPGFSWTDIGGRVRFRANPESSV